MAIDIRPATWKRSWLKSGDVIAIVDAGPPYAAVDKSDDDHERSVKLLQRALIFAW